MHLKKYICILVLTFLTLFTPEKGCAKTKQQKHNSLSLQGQNKKIENLKRPKIANQVSSCKRKEITKKNKKQKFNKIETYVTKTLKDFSISVPSHWQCINDPSQLPENVLAIFISNKENKGSLTPTINISTEITQLSQDFYVTEALKYHNSQENNIQSHIFDVISTPAGSAYILRSERLTQFGEVTFIQGILINKKKAYVVTCSSTKELLGSLFPIFIKAISSFSLEKKS